MNLNEFIQGLSERLGLEASEEVQNLLNNPALANISVPSNVVQSFQAKLYTEEEAKRSYEIKKHFTGSALNAVDKQLLEVLEAYTMDDETKGMILAETNTYKRIPLLAKAIAETKEKAISATGGEKKALLDKINELQSLLNSEKESRKQDVEKLNSQWTNQLTDKELQAMFNGYDYALDLDKEVTISTARNLWEKKLREKGGKYVYTQEGIKLVNAEAPDLPFTIDNKTVDVRSFTDSVLADAKLLKVNKPAGMPAQGVPTPTPNVVKAAAPAAKAQTSKALADFKAGSNLV